MRTKLTIDLQHFYRHLRSQKINYEVLKEMRRVLRYGSEAYLVLGDSAPYGIYVPTTQILGDIALSAGFTEFSIHKIRSRGDKWKNLKNRHNISLSENILILK